MALFPVNMAGEIRFLNSGGGQHLKRPNVELPIFRNFEISNMNITEIKFFDFSIFDFF